ncbi:DTW domain-containing protein, partial [Coemansia spiralis]
SDRISCSTCGKSVKFFCYHCCMPIPALSEKIPKIRLPFKLDIIKHPKELNGKSTALHAKIIAPEDVEIVSYSGSCMSGADISKTVLLFPGPDAKSISEMDPVLLDRAVVIDGTWSQAKTMVRDNPELHKMQKVTINPRTTRFWRYQNLDESYLATIEAIYFLYRDSIPNGYNGEYDALMYFYKYFYDLIQSEYAAVPEKRFHSRHQQDYI